MVDTLHPPGATPATRPARIVVVPEAQPGGSPPGAPARPDVAPGGSPAVAGMAAAARVDGNSARTIFEILAAGKDYQRVIEDKVKSLKKPDATPTELALALDLEQAGIELEMVKMREIHQQRGRLPAELQKKWEDLAKRREALGKERESGPVASTPNELTKLASLLGSPEEAAKTPLVAMEGMVRAAIERPQARRDLIGNLRREVGNGTIPLTEDQVKAFETYLDESAKRLSLEKNAKFLAKGAGLTGLLMLVMFWVSSKGESQGVGH